MTLQAAHRISSTLSLVAVARVFSVVLVALAGVATGCGGAARAGFRLDLLGGPNTGPYAVVEAAAGNLAVDWRKDQLTLVSVNGSVLPAWNLGGRDQFSVAGTAGVGVMGAFTSENTSAVLVGLALEFGAGLAFHPSACAVFPVGSDRGLVLAPNVQGCLRYSTNGWLGVDIGGGYYAGLGSD